MERQVSPPTAVMAAESEPPERGTCDFDPEQFRRFNAGESVHSPRGKVQVIRDEASGTYGIVESPQGRQTAGAASRLLGGGLQDPTELSEKHGRLRFDVSRPLESMRSVFRRAEDVLRRKTPESEVLTAAATVIRFFQDGTATRMAYGHIGHGRLFRAPGEGGELEQLSEDRTTDDTPHSARSRTEPQTGVVDVRENDRFIIMSERSLGKKPDASRIGEALAMRIPREAAEALRRASGDIDEEEEQAVLVIDAPRVLEPRAAATTAADEAGDPIDNSTGKENRLVAFVKDPFQEVGMYMTAGAMASTTMLGMALPWKRRRDPVPVTETTVAQRPVVHDTARPADAPRVEERPVRREGSSSVTTPEQAHRSSRMRDAALVVGSLLVGGVLGYVFKDGGGPDINLPEWMAGDMGRFNELADDGFDIPEIRTIMADPPEFNPNLLPELQELGVEQDTIERIFENLALYGRMIDAEIPEERVIEFFQNGELFDRIDLDGVSTAELPAVAEQTEVYVEVVASGLTPDAAADFVKYPDLVDLWKDQGEESELIAAIIDNDPLFNSLAELNLPYENIREIMLNPEDFREVLLLLADENLTADEFIELLNGAEASVENPGSAEPGGAVDEPMAPGEDETPGVVAGASDPFFTENGHGFTHEIDDELDTIGIDNPPAEDAAMHVRLIDKYGVDYLTGIPKYELPEGVWGDYGLAHSGTAQWAPGVESDIHNWGREYAAN